MRGRPPEGLTGARSHLEWARERVAAAREAVRRRWEEIDGLAEANFRRVLSAFWEQRISESHLAGTTGYGYHDVARDAIEALFAAVFGGEAAVVRPQLVSGTHALSACFFGCLRPGERLLSVTGPPYDTLQRVIGLGAEPLSGSLAAWGIGCEVIPLTPDGRIDTGALAQALTPATTAVFIQRSRGYAQRVALGVGEIRRAIAAIRRLAPEVTVIVDNCYGEFAESEEPCHAGADLCAGSLIKNPGGTLAPTGGYIVGRAEPVARAADHITAPGLGRHVGPLLDLARPIMQGLFLAPRFAAEAMAGAVLAAQLFADCGFAVEPAWDAPRADVIQALEMGSEQATLAFCRAVQRAGPIDSFVRPEPWAMPGYADPVVMAAGTFVQGASSELSADAPLRPPYTVYLQAGPLREHAAIACELILAELAAGGHLPGG